MVLVVKNLAASVGDARDVGWIPGSRRPPGGGHGNPFQYSCPENPMDRGDWQATVHKVAKSQTQLKQLSMRECTRTHINVLSIFFFWKFVWASIRNIYE